MPVKPLTAKKKKIVIIFILLLRFQPDNDICQYGLTLIAFFNAIKDKTDENQLTVGQLSQLASIDAWYSTLDEENDPEDFDACEVSDLPAEFMEAAENF